MLIRFSFADRNTFGSSFTRFSPNDCVQAGIINNHVSSAAPSNSATWKEFERSGQWLFSGTALSGYVDVSTSNREDWSALVVGSDRTTRNHNGFRLSCKIALTELHLSGLCQTSLRRSATGLKLPG